MLSAAYLALIIFILLIETTRKKASKFDFLSLFNIFFLIWYPLPALILNMNQFNYSLDVLALKFDNPHYLGNIKTAVAIFLGYFCVLFGFYSKSARYSAENVIIKFSSDKRNIACAVALSLFAFVSMYLYSSQQGGFSNALSQAMLFRVSAEYNLESGGNLLFFKLLMFYSFLSSYLLFSFLLFKRDKKHNLLARSTFLSIAFIFSTTISILAAMMAGGRQRLINYLLIFYLGYVLKTRKFHLPLVIPLLIFSIIFILYGKAFFFSLTALPDGLNAVVDAFIVSIQTKSSDDEFNFYTFVAGFAYPVHSLDAAFDNQYDMRLFIDLLLGFVDLIPKRLFGIESPKTVVDYNTYFITKTNDYLIPPGFIAFAVYSMSWAGIIIFCLLFGWLGRYLQTVLERHLKATYWMPFFYALTARFWTDYCGSGDPQYFIKGYFWYLTASFFLLFIVNKISLAKESVNRFKRKINTL